MVVKALSTYAVTALAVTGSIAWARRAARHHRVTIRLEGRGPAAGRPRPGAAPGGLTRKTVV